MPVDEADVESAVKKTLVGLDDDLQSYIAGCLLDDDGEVLARDELLELVVPMLEELCGGDDSLATSKADSLWHALTGGAGALEYVDKEPIALAQAVRVAGEDEPTTEVVAAEPEIDDSKLRAAAAKKAQAVADAKKAEADRMARGIAELAAELEAAREKAAKIRATSGAARPGPLVLQNFVIPNPGGGANLLEDAALTLVPGHRYGLIGRNGKGKSTLLRALAARRVGNLADNLAIHYVSQEVVLSAESENATPVTVVLEADVERRLLLEESNALKTALNATPESMQRLAQVDERLEEIEAATAPERADALLKNLGFTQELRSRPMRALSGGWRVRTALAAALFAKPDLLLLDEPTNHLSIYAVLWLAREIATNPVWSNKIVVIVSHDRAFIDDSCTHMLHISGIARRLTQSKGSYSTWASRRAEQQKAWKRTAELRAEKREKLKAYTQHGFKYGGSSGQIAMQQKKLKEIEKLDVEAEAEAEELAALNEDEELPLSLEAGGGFDGPAVQLDAVGFNYEGSAPLFKNVDLNIDSKSRVCLIGENGAGKTTLVKLIMGDLEATTGQITRAGGVRIALVNQHHADQLDFDVTPLQFMLDKFPGDGSLEHSQKLRGHLAGCGLDAHLQTTLARGLSGGQRSRVAMAAVSYSRPHVLIMDEPTNNLDLEAVSALADCLQRFEGGVVLVSHDSWFVERVANEIVVVQDGLVTRLESFEAYKSGVLAKLV